MAEPTEAELDTLMATALQDAGSKITWQRPTSPTLVLPEAHALDEPDEPDEPVLVPDAAIEPEPTHTPPPAPTPASHAETQHFVTRDDMQAMTDRLAQQHREDMAALIASLRTPAPAADATAPATSPAASPKLTDALRKAYVEGDFTEAEAWERYQAQQVAEQQARDAQRTTQQKLITNLATSYPFLRDAEGWNAMVPEYLAILQAPISADTFPADPKYMVELGGRQVDLRIAQAAAEIVKAKREAAAQRQADQDAAAAAEAARVADAAKQTTPAPNGGTQQQQRPKTEPKYLVPGGIVTGNDPLLANPAIQKALEAVGWGKDPKTQAKRLAERLPAHTQEQLRTLHRQGRDGVGTV